MNLYFSLLWVTSCDQMDMREYYSTHTAFAVTRKIGGFCGEKWGRKKSYGERHSNYLILSGRGHQQLARRRPRRGWHRRPRRLSRGRRSVHGGVPHAAGLHGSGGRVCVRGPFLAGALCCAVEGINCVRRVDFEPLIEGIGRLWMKMLKAK